MDLVMYRKLTIFAAVLLVYCAEALGSTRPRFTPLRYVQYNNVIVEGVVISDEEAPVENRIGNTGWFYPTNWACVVVDSIVQQPADASYATGDTICFRYATSNNSYNPNKPGLGRTISGFNGPLGASIGRHGLYAFWCYKGECRKGDWFAVDDSLVSGIHDVLKRIAADSVESGK